MSLADAIRAFARTYSVSRAGAGSYVNGRYVPAATTTVTVSASVQPTSGRDLLLLEEGARVRESITIYTPDPITVGDAPNGADADVITYNGSRYRVMSVEAWTEIGGFSKAVASKILEGSST